jgi:protein SCO1/2
MAGAMSLRSLGPRVLLSCLLVQSTACEEKPDDAGHPIAQGTRDGSGPLPVLSLVPPFSFTNEDGKPLGSKELAGKPYLVAFMFTRCPSICPELTRRMKTVDEAAKKSKKTLQLVSISVDPENDKPEVLNAYAKKQGADVENWAFLTGDHREIAKTSEEGFKMAFSGQIDETKPHLGITHGSHLILVDQVGQIRGYFRSTEDESVQAILDALSRL